MTRTLALLTSITLATTIAASCPGTPAQAAPSCHGQPATIVGAPRSVVTGTPGRDVIVTHGARRVRGLAGNDLICVDRAPKGQVFVEAGDGDDVTSIVDRHSYVVYDSGRGSDTYRSAGSSDRVTLYDDGRDVVSTGKRFDLVTVRHAGRPGTPRVQLGGRGDVLVLQVGRSRGHFDGGGDGDVLSFRHRSQEVWTVDNQRQRAVAGTEVRLRWRGFDTFSLRSLRVPEIRFVGSDDDERVDGGLSRAHLDMAGGGGDDTLLGGRGDDTLDGGPGDDLASGDDGFDTCVNAEQVEECEEVR